MRATWQALLDGEKKKKGEIIVPQTKLPVGIWRLQGVNMRSDLWGEAPVGNRNLPGTLLFIFIIGSATFDVSLDMRVHTTCGTSRVNPVIKKGFGSKSV